MQEGLRAFGSAISNISSHVLMTTLMSPAVVLHLIAGTGHWGDSGGGNVVVVHGRNLRSNVQVPSPTTRGGGSRI